MESELERFAIEAAAAALEAAIPAAPALASPGSGNPPSPRTGVKKGKSMLVSFWFIYVATRSSDDQLPRLF
jgi:hypothetical protein